MSVEDIKMFDIADIAKQFMIINLGASAYAESC